MGIGDSQHLLKFGAHGPVLCLFPRSSLVGTARGMQIDKYLVFWPQAMRHFMLLLLLILTTIIIGVHYFPLSQMSKVEAWEGSHGTGKWQSQV